MKYIDYHKVFTQAEISALTTVARHLSVFLRQVPVRRDGDAGGQVVMDLSFTLSRKSLLESFAVIKRFHARFSQGKSVFDPMWRLISKPIGQANAHELEDFTNLVLAIEPFCVHLEELLTGRRPRHRVYNDFFNAFREKKEGETGFSSILPVNGATNEFFRTLKEVRNMVGHGKEGLPVEDGRLMITSGLVMIVNRFYRELDALLFAENEHVEFSPEDISSDHSLRQWAEEYMERQREIRVAKAKKSLRDRFAGTLLANCDDLSARLPQIDCNGELSFRPGVTYLVGKPGAGVSTMIDRMVINGTPCRHTIVVDSYIYNCRHDMQWLVALMAGDDFMSHTPLQIEALTQWLSVSLADGQIAVVVDDNHTINAATKSYYGPLFAHLKETMFIVSARADNEDSIEQNIKKNSRVVSSAPLTDSQKSELVELMSTMLFRDADMSHLLAARLDRVSGEIDMSLPLVFVNVIDILARHLGETWLNHTEFVCELYRRCGAAVADSAAVSAFQDDCKTIKAQADSIYETYYKGSGAEACRSLIDGFAFLSSKKAIRRFFEICHVLRGNDRIDLLATLAARYILADDDNRQSASCGCNPGLVQLADFIRTVNVEQPANRKDDIVFRPSPRYIVERYVVNMLRMHSHDQNSDGLLRAAASTATPMVIGELFSERWIEAVLSGHFLSVAAQYGISAPVDFALALVRHFAHKSLIGRLDESHNHLQLYIATLKILNDAQRFELVDRLHAEASYLKYTAMPTGMCCNLALLTLDVPSGARYYDTKASFPFLDIEFWKDFASRAVLGAVSLPLLFKAAVHACESRNFGLVKHFLSGMISGGVYRSEGFKAFIAKISSINEIKDDVKHAIGRIPLGEIDPNIAIGLYNPTLTDLAIRNKWSESLPLTVTNVNEPTTEMLVPAVDISNRGEEQAKYSYTIYSYSDEGVQLATEPFSDNRIEGRFICISDFVAGSVSGIERVAPMSGNDCYAHLYVEWRHDMQLQNRHGFLYFSLGRGCFQKKIAFINSFVDEEGMRAIFRINDSDTIAAIASGPADSVTVKCCGQVLGVSEVRIVRFKTPQTLVTVECTDRKKVLQLIPQQGMFSVHYTPNVNAPQFQKVLFLPVAAGPSRTAMPLLPSLAVLGFYNGYVLMGYEGETFARGTFLHHKATKTSMRVVRSYSMANKESIPADISDLFFSTLSALKRDGKKIPYCNAVVMAEPCDVDFDGLPHELAIVGSVVKNGIERWWCNQVFVPAFDSSAPQATKSWSCCWLPVHVCPDGPKFRTDVPYAPSLAKTAFMQLINTPFTFTARFKDGRLIPDRMLNSLFRDRLLGQRSEEPFFAMFLDGRRQPIVAEYDDIHNLVELAGNWGDIRPESRDIIKRL